MDGPHCHARRRACACFLHKPNWTKRRSGVPPSAGDILPGRSRTRPNCCRCRQTVAHLIYASSSSVYGGNTRMPFSVHDNVDHPFSLYAATKKANELMAHAYSHLFGLPTTGLRFFTVYCPWGRPDMALFIFTKAILSGEPI